jgi:hypothetical protein
MISGPTFDGSVRTGAAIEKFFEHFNEKTVIGVVLPTGWLGRPWDNYYDLPSIRVEQDSARLFVDLGWGWTLEFLPVYCGYYFSPLDLTAGLDIAVIDGSAHAQNRSHSSFADGRIRFCINLAQRSTAEMNSGAWKLRLRATLDELLTTAIDSVPE